MIAAGVVRSRSSRFHRHIFRVLGWLALAAAAPALYACTARSLEPPVLKPDPTQTGSIVLTANRNVDLLFLIDDSSSMAKSQENLRRNFPAFMTALKALPGGLPNVHIAVVSSDMGAGDGSIAGCDANGGKNGIFQYTARGSCTATNLDPNATFISDIAGVRNYSGNLEDVFSCIAALGESGCGFEHQFAAITRALGADGQAPPAENQGFLRPEAYLAIVMITNEDDCSASPGIPLYDGSNVSISDPLGPPVNFRCNEYGHVCDGVHPDRHAPNGDINATVTYDSCTSAEDGALRLGCMPSHIWPNSLQRKFAGGPSCDMMFVFEPVSNSGTPGDAEQSSSLVIRTMARYASGRRKPWFSAGAARPSAPSARRIEANWCSKPQPVSPSAAMQVNASASAPV